MTESDYVPNVYFSFYRLNDGCIEGYTVCKQDKSDLAVDLTVYNIVEGFYPSDKFYYDLVENLVKEKTLMEISISSYSIKSDGTDASVLTNIPAGTEVTVDSVTTPMEGICNDGSIEFTTIFPGNHRISLKNIKFLDFEVWINAI